TPRGIAASQGIPFFMPPQFYLPGVIFFGAAVFGAWRLYRRRKHELNGSQIRLIQICLLLLVLVAASFLGFIWTFFQAQGRYLYPAMLPISVFFAAGLRWAAPEPNRTWAFLFALIVLV